MAFFPDNYFRLSALGDSSRPLSPPRPLSPSRRCTDPNASLSWEDFRIVRSASSSPAFSSLASYVASSAPTSPPLSKIGWLGIKKHPTKGFKVQMKSKRHGDLIIKFFPEQREAQMIRDCIAHKLNNDAENSNYKVVYEFDDIDEFIREFFNSIGGVEDMVNHIQEKSFMKAYRDFKWQPLSVDYKLQGLPSSKLPEANNSTNQPNGGKLLNIQQQLNEFFEDSLEKAKKIKHSFEIEETELLHSAGIAQRTTVGSTFLDLQGRQQIQQIPAQVITVEPTSNMDLQRGRQIPVQGGRQIPAQLTTVGSTDLQGGQQILAQLTTVDSTILDFQGGQQTYSQNITKFSDSQYLYRGNPIEEQMRPATKFFDSSGP